MTMQNQRIPRSDALPRLKYCFFSFFHGCRFQTGFFFSLYFALQPAALPDFLFCMPGARLEITWLRALGSCLFTAGGCQNSACHCFFFYGMHKGVRPLFNHQFATDMFIVRIGLDTQEGVYHCLIQGKNMLFVIHQLCFSAVCCALAYMRLCARNTCARRERRMLFRLCADWRRWHACLRSY